MIKLKNKELSVLNSVLISLGNHQTDIAKKWEIAKFTKRVDDAFSLFNSQVQTLINDQGKDDGKGNKSLNTNNPDYLKLLDLDIDIDIDKLSINELEKFNPSIQELMGLSPVIKEE